MKTFVRAILLVCAFTSGNVLAAVSDYFVNPEYVASNLKNLTILDARGYPAYLQGHLSGAIAINWKSLSHTEGNTADKGWGNLLDNS